MPCRRAILLALAAAISLPAAASWSASRTAHFTLYSHQNPAEARAVLDWFEQLRSIATVHFGLNTADDRPVLIFAFDSESEYDPYRIRPTADAYYVGADERDYIVMAALGPSAFSTAAHEYAHLLLHRTGTHLPPWLAEGLADVFSTIRIARDGVRVGGEPFGRLAPLRRQPWLPLETLLTLPADSPLRDTRDGTDIFYAQSWALTEMLALSPPYASRFQAFAADVAHTSSNSAAALEHTYGKPLSDIAADVKTWALRRSHKPILLEPTGPHAASTVATAEESDFAVRSLLAAMLLAAEDLDRAQSAYRSLALEAPDEPSVLAGLAAIALARNQTGESLALFHEALAHGLADAGLCYRYAVLLDRTGAPAEERRSALERAIALRPSFDEARYSLALLEKNLGNNDAALRQLLAMRPVAPPRAYHYWFAMADALTGLGRNDEAGAAARKAAAFAADPQERFRALELAHIAQTHVEVRFARDASGGQQIVTTRAPNGSAWNPFIEPADEIRRTEGTLLEVDCGAVLRLTVGTAAGNDTFTIPDPSRVQMRNAPAEFTCGPQLPVSVMVDYAAPQPGHTAIARGIEFLSGKP